jgi:general secretion pathway protein I
VTGSPRHSAARDDGFSRSRRRGAAGFTLLEVLVAFTILALMMTVLLRIFSEGFRGMTAAEVHAAAALHAQAALASVGAEIPLAVGDWTGEHDDGFRWHVRIDLYDEPAMVVPPRSFLVYQIVASADPGAGAGGVTLSSLRIGAAEPALPGEEEGGGEASR